MNYYEHHIGDYAADAGHLSWDEDMAYTRLIRAYYKSEKPIPSDPAEACRIARATTPAQKRAVESVLREFFVLTDEGWRQKRCEAEIDRYKSKSDKAKASANARWENVKSQSKGNADAMRSHTEGNAHQTPDTRHQTPDTKIPPNPRAGGIPAGVQDVFDYWQRVMNHPSAKLDSKREKCIRSAFKLGYTTDDLMRAIDGCASSSWHMGQNPDRTIYDQLTLILRDASHIDQFMKRATMGPPINGNGASKHQQGFDEFMDMMRGNENAG